MASGTDLLNVLTDKDNLKENLSFIALYISIFESMSDIIIDRIEGFLCNEAVFRNGRVKFIKNKEYKDVIEQRKVDEQGNKDVLKASLLWLKDNGAITDEDYNTFLKAKGQRNRFVHELCDIVLRDVNEEEFKMCIDLFALFKKIDNWWINEIEIPCSCVALPGEIDEKNVRSAIIDVFEIMISTLYLEGSNESSKPTESNAEE